MSTFHRLLALASLAIVGANATSVACAQSPDHLAPLEWMIGEWTGDTPNGSVMLSAQWSDNGNFIVRKFLIVGDDSEIGGSQRIGWDPRKKQIKSWSFDSQGGFGDGYWRQDGTRWIVDSTEVTADGQEIKLAATYTPVNQDKFVWEVNNAKLAEAGLPAIRVEFTRAKAEENSDDTQ